MKCSGSGKRVDISVGQEKHTAGYVKSNRAINVRCPDCKYVADSARIVRTDHGIPTGPRAIIPTHTQQ